MTTDQLSPLVVSGCALAFTLFSFYRMNWRRGRLVVAKPRGYAVARPIGGDAIVLWVPFVLVNSGARPLIVQNLRLVVPDFGGADTPFILQSVSSKLALDAEHTLAVQFPVRSREATTVIGEFYRTPANVVFEAKTYRVQLQGLLNQAPKWKNLCSFDLRVHQQNVDTLNRGTFLAVDNEIGSHRMLDALALQKQSRHRA